MAAVRSTNRARAIIIVYQAFNFKRTLIAYVHDIIITGNDPDEKEALGKYLAKEFKIRDLGKLKYFLRIDVARSKEGIFVSQQKYVLDLLKETVRGGPSSRSSKGSHVVTSKLESFLPLKFLLNSPNQTQD
ncbi:hypothetical protein RJ640_022125 [Escallonia rubra]|uniref:Reverse transcriptase Ty1/copia-type domain-containing protein n=1 Tax=Escallonia rubra TaxID=112253 RepID=A0AA88UT43_9ASTE|nr:hypothetical protein RJ640_022125 [Escallonia rubra]